MISIDNIFTMMLVVSGHFWTSIDHIVSFPDNTDE